MTLEEMKAELDKWLKEWEKDLTDDIVYLNHVSDMIDYWNERIKVATLKGE